jgi:group II intron reverse transcriptase/maturase
MAKEARSSMAEMSDTDPGDSGRKPRGTGDGASSVTARREHDCGEGEGLMEVVVGRGNMIAAYKRVVRNKGSVGMDGMRVEELKPFLNAHWERIKSELLEGGYRPQPVRQVEIPKPGGGVRKLGIPTVVDRLIGQALHQALEPIFDPTFSKSSYGFRRGRSAHQAVEQAREYVREGYRWVVDIDLEKFFDRVNHDILMSRIARRVKDKRVLRLIRRYLQAGIMTDGVVSARSEGTPQGSPLSPWLSNIMLDDLDKELERRGHRFCRYADDANIYVRSRRAGERVMASITRFLERKLRLKVNTEKSAVGRPWKLKFLGYSMTREYNARLRVSWQSVQRLKRALREIFRRGRGRSLAQIIEELNRKLRGWISYFRLFEGKNIFEELDGWIRRRLRCIIWRHWKRAPTRARNLMQRGLAEARARQSATNGRGPWWNAGAAHMYVAFKKSYFDKLGLVSLLDTILTIRNTSRTAVYGTVRTVV